MGGRHGSSSLDGRSAKRRGARLRKSLLDRVASKRVVGFDCSFTF